jgi:hypothetical protein
MCEHAERGIDANSTVGFVAVAERHVDVFEHLLATQPLANRSRCQLRRADHGIERGGVDGKSLEESLRH